MHVQQHIVFARAIERASVLDPNAACFFYNSFDLDGIGFQSFAKMRLDCWNYDLVVVVGDEFGCLGTTDSCKIITGRFVLLLK